MFRHYLKTAFRFLKRNRLYTFINALGLSISLAVSFIILLFVINEFSYDHGHKKRKQVYRVVTYYKEFKQTMAGTPYVLAKTLKEDFPQVEKACNVRSLRGFKLKKEDEFVDISFPMATDSEILDIFTLPIIGSLLNDDPLQDLNSMLISEKLADQFFPGINPVGQEIEALLNNSNQVLTISGVFKDLPGNSTFRADCFLNGAWTLEPLNQAFGVDNMDVSWGHDFWNTWLLLAGDADPDELNAQFEAFEKKHIHEDPHCHFSLQNLSDVYLRSEDIANTRVTGNIKNIRLFSTVAVLILLIASFNYIILSNAVSTGRAKEIGIRKTAGASISGIRNQVLSESIMLSILVLPVALLFMWLGKPVAEKLFQTSLEVIPANLGLYIPFYVLLTILIGMVSGLYASSYLSRLKVLEVLKQQLSFGRKRKVFRSLLIVIQLVIFCAFVSGTLVIRSQYNYALKKDPGYYHQDVLQIYLGRDFPAYDAFLEGIRSVPEVLHAAGAMDGLPMNGWGVMMFPHFKDEGVKVKVEGFSVDYGFMETMGFSLLEGRTFSPDYGSDLGNAVILNETAIRELGIDDPLEQFIYDSTAIIGVVKDFNLHSIHTEIPPLLISMTDRYLHNILVHYRSGSLSELIPKLEEEWKKVEPDRPFNAVTIEELFEQAYAAEKNLSSIISIAALFTFLIAAFGLLGLTLFVARSRTQEIGIRKVFGSSESAIVYSFLRSNLLLVLVAELISIPLSLYFMGKWLNNFPYRVEIGGWVFVFALLLAILVVLLTVSVHAIKASRINPVEALRYE